MCDSRKRRKLASSRGHPHQRHAPARKTNENNIIKTVKKIESNESPHQRNRRLASSSCKGWNADYKAATKSRSGRVLCVALVHHAATAPFVRGGRTLEICSFTPERRHARVTEYKSSPHNRFRRPFAPVRLMCNLFLKAA